jgi:hypothetical protein
MLKFCNSSSCSLFVARDKSGHQRDGGKWHVYITYLQMFLPKTQLIRHTKANIFLTRTAKKFYLFISG